jgi:hypothetical protein
VLPLSTNPREGWKPGLKGETAASLKEEIMNSKRLKRSVLMTDRGDYRAEVSDTIASRVASYDVDEFNRSRQISRSGTGILSPSQSIASRSRRELLPGNDDSSYGLDEFEDEEETELGDGGDNDTFRYRTEDGEGEEDDESDFLKEESSPDGHLLLPSSAENQLPGTSSATVACHGNSDSLKKGLLTSLAMNGTTLSTIPQPLESSWDDGGDGLLAAIGLEGQLNEGGRTARKVNDDVILDLKEAIERIGAPNKRQIHSLNLRSVYESYSVGGEPLYTHSKPADHAKGHGVCCLDYLFFSSHSLSPWKLLSIPQLTSLSLQGDDPAQSLITTDPYWDLPPPSFRDIFNNHHRDLPQSKETSREHRSQEVGKIKEKLTRILREGDTSGMYSKFWGGKWIPFACVNLQRSHSWLPNDAFASSHLALCAYFQINEDYTATQWTSS